MSEWVVLGLVLLFSAIGFIFGYRARIAEVALIAGDSRRSDFAVLSDEQIRKSTHETRYINALNIIGSVFEIALIAMVILRFDTKITYTTASICCLLFVATLTLVVFRFIDARKR